MSVDESNRETAFSTTEAATDPSCVSERAARLVRIIGERQRVLFVEEAPENVVQSLRKNGCELWVTAPGGGKARKGAGAAIRSLTRGRSKAPSAFDAIVVDSVLERSADPAAHLRRLASLVRPGGSLVCSVRNATHADLRLAFLGGDVPYANDVAGAPLRLFTRRGIERLFDEAGLAIGLVERIERQPSVVPEGMDARTADEVVRSLLADREALTREFLIVAYPLGDPTYEVIHRRMKDLAARSEAADAEAKWLLRSLADAEVEAVNLASQVNRYEKQTFELRSQLRTAQADAAVRSHEAKSLKDQLETAEWQLNDRDERVKKLQQEIREREAAASSQPNRQAVEREIAERDLRLAERDLRLGELRTEAENLHREVAVRDAMIESLRAQIAVLHAQVADQAEKLQDALRSAAAAREEAESERAQRVRQVVDHARSLDQVRAELQLSGGAAAEERRGLEERLHEVHAELQRVMTEAKAATGERQALVVALEEMRRTSVEERQVLEAALEETRRIASEERQVLEAALEETRRIASEERQVLEAALEETRRIASEERQALEAALEETGRTAFEERQVFEAALEETRRTASEERQVFEAALEETRRTASEERQVLEAALEETRRSASEEREVLQAAVDEVQRMASEDHRIAEDALETARRAAARERRTGEAALEELRQAAEVQRRELERAVEEARRGTADQQRHFESILEELRREAGARGEALQRAQYELDLIRGSRWWRLVGIWSRLAQR